MSTTDRGAFDQAEYDRRFHGDFMYDATLEDEEGGSTRSPLFVILTALVLTAFGAVIYVAYQQGKTQGDRGAPPIIAAEKGPIRVQPENPGGVTVPDQDKLIYERIAGANPEPAESGLAAPPEVPQDLPQPAMTAAADDEAGLETPGAAEEGDTALALDAATAAPSAAQIAAEKAAKQQAAALTSEIEQIDPGAADAAAQTAAATSGAFVVQIGAFKEDAEAAGQWQTFKKRNTDLTGALKPDIKRVDLGAKGIWYRLRVGPFETKQNAVAFCEVVKTRGGGCNVTAP